MEKYGIEVIYSRVEAAPGNRQTTLQDFRALDPRIHRD
jgi:hypothetical protein